MPAFWQAKIWGLLHDPALKALHDNTGRGSNSFWKQLEVMQDWQDKGWNPETSGGIVWKHIHLADYIASASDRGAIGLESRVGNSPKLTKKFGIGIRTKNARQGDTSPAAPIITVVANLTRLSEAF